MSMNRLNLESLLGRFFDASMLSTYCTSRLGQSGKGNSSVLASRICRAWSKPTFEPNALESTRVEKASSTKKSAATTQSRKRKRPIAAVTVTRGQSFQTIATQHAGHSHVCNTFIVRRTGTDDTVPLRINTPRAIAMMMHAMHILSDRA